MKQISVAFVVGLLSFTAGAGGLLLLVRFGGGSVEGSARTVQNVAAFVALLLGSGGGFLALCAGPVLLLNLLTQPRGSRQKG